MKVLNSRPGELEGTIRFGLSVLLVLPECSAYVGLGKGATTADVYGWSCVSIHA